jgi:hypothetical protein
VTLRETTTLWGSHLSRTHAHLAYVGHAERWDSAEIDGQLDAATQDCTITYRRGGKKLAVAVVHRDLAGLRAEAEFERTTRGEPA